MKFLAVIAIFVISSLLFFAQETIDTLLLNLMLVMG